MSAVYQTPHDDLFLHGLLCLSQCAVCFSDNGRNIWLRVQNYIFFRFLGYKVFRFLGFLGYFLGYKVASLVRL